MRFKTLAEGAASSVPLVTLPQLEHVGERYSEDCNEALMLAGKILGGHVAGVAADAVDPDNATWLWELSLRAFGWAKRAAPGSHQHRARAAASREQRHSGLIGGGSARWPRPVASR
jgi:hypothetical protein